MKTRSRQTQERFYQWAAPPHSHPKLAPSHAKFSTCCTRKISSSWEIRHLRKKSNPWLTKKKGLFIILNHLAIWFKLDYITEANLETAESKSETRLIMNKVEEGGVENGRRGEAMDAIAINMDGEDTSYCGSCISTLIFVVSAILIVFTFPFSLCVCIKMVQVWNYSFSQLTFTRPVDQKAVTHLIFLLERTDLKNVIFEKISLCPFWGF